VRRDNHNVKCCQVLSMKIIAVNPDEREIYKRFILRCENTEVVYELQKFG
jgi:hypothetical protein